VAFAIHVVRERLALDVLRDEIPIARIRLAGPVDLHDIGMVHSSKRGDLAAHGFVASSVLEELESALLTLDVVTDSIDGGESTLSSMSRISNLPSMISPIEYSVAFLRDGELTSAGSGSGNNFAELRSVPCRQAVAIGSHAMLDGLVAVHTRSVDPRCR